MADLEVLIERWRSGDERAAEAIYDLHRDRTYRLALGLLGNAEDAEEAAQDALTYALLHIEQFDSQRSRFTTWLHMITVSRSRDLLRKRRQPTFLLTEWLARRLNTADPRPGPETKAEVSERRSDIWKAIQALKPPLREAILLRHWANHTYQEIAEIVGCPMKTAQSRVRLAHEKLAEMLSENDLLQNTEVIR